MAEERRIIPSEAIKKSKFLLTNKHLKLDELELGQEGQLKIDFEVDNLSIEDEGGVNYLKALLKIKKVTKESVKRSELNSNHKK